MPFPSTALFPGADLFPAGLPRTPIDALDRVRLDVERDLGPGEFVNLIQNPSGDLGGWGWITPVASTALSGGAELAYAGVASAANWFTSELAPVVAGQYVAATWTNPFHTNSGLARARLVWCDSTGAVVSSGTQSNYETAAGTYSIPATVVPAGVTQVALRFDLYSTTGGANPTSTTKSLWLTGVTVATSANSAYLVAGRTNLIPNPSFETDITGWTVSSGTRSNEVLASQGSWMLRLDKTSSPIQTVYDPVTTPIAITAGLPYTFSVDARRASATAAFAATPRIVWKNGSGLAIRVDNGAAVTMTTAYQRLSLTRTAPVGAVTAVVGVLTPDDVTGTTHRIWYLDAAMLEQASSVGTYIEGTITTGSLPTLPAAYYVTITGEAASISIERNELDQSTLTSSIVSASLDPADTTLLRPDRRCRVLVDVGPDGSPDWEPIFTGKTLTASVEYHLLEVDEERRAVISLTAVDPLTRLAQEGRPDGVKTIPELPFVLEGCGVPWNVNGSGNQVTTATVVASNDQASAVDQIAVTRDTNSGFAWIDRRGVLQVWDAALIASVVADTLDESTYTTDLGISYATDRIINSVSVDSYEVNPATGETGTASYGPYRAAGLKPTDSIYDKTITVQGLTETQIGLLATNILTANATPTRRIDYVNIPLTLETLGRALLDLYDLVTVVNDRAGLRDNLRIVKVTHTINATTKGTTWLVRLDFNVADSIAAPQLIPPPSTGSGAALIPATVFGGSLSASTDGSGLVTVTHGGPRTPDAVLLSGRNSAWEPVLSALSSTTITVRFQRRSTEATAPASTAVSFDWEVLYS